MSVAQMRATGTQAVSLERVRTVSHTTNSAASHSVLVEARYWGALVDPGQQVAASSTTSSQNAVSGRNK
eukprot:5536935-Prymnesium_polylepis.2